MNFNGCTYYCLCKSILWHEGNITQSAQRKSTEGAEAASSLGDGDFFVGAEDGAHGFADFAEGGVGFHGIVDVRHEIFGTFGGFAEGVEAALDFGGRTIGAELAQALGLP